jgi:hypothetical protein
MSSGLRTGLSDGVLFVVRVALVTAVATVSYHLVEVPFRKVGGAWTTRRLAGVLALPALAVVAIVMAVPVREPEVIDLTALSTEEGPLFLDPVAPVAPAGAAAGPEAPPADPARVLLVGDSVSWTMLGGLITWNEQNERQVHVDSYRAIGCTLAEAGTVRSLGKIEHPIKPCLDFRRGLGPTLEARDYDAIVVAMGHKDLSDRQIDGDAWRHFGDPVFDQWWRGQADELAGILAAEEVPVLWATAPVTNLVRPEDPSRGPEDYPDNDRARVDRLNGILRDVVAGHEGMAIADVYGWLRAMPGGETDPDLLVDGVHWSMTGSNALAAWLVPQVLDATDADAGEAAGGAVGGGPAPGGQASG